MVASKYLKLWRDIFLTTEISLNQKNWRIQINNGLLDKIVLRQKGI
jgi:hypothetical protein